MKCFRVSVLNSSVSNQIFPFLPEKWHNIANKRLFYQLNGEETGKCPEFEQKKWRLEIFISTLHSEMLFEAETSEFCCEIKF